MGNPEGKRPHGSPRLRQKNYIMMDLLEVGWSAMAWIDVALGMDQWRDLVNMVTNLRIP
jgi:hypothetical protein